MFHKCCVDNCASRRQQGVKLHKFPASEIGLQKWLQCINSDRLRQLSINELRKVFVCHKHFELRFITDKNRIRLGGYPTLFSQEEIDSGSPSVPHEADLSEHVIFDHCYERRRQHEDHTYAKGNSSEADGQPLDIQPAALDPHSHPDMPTVSGLPLVQQPVAQEIQNLPNQPFVSRPQGLSQDQQPVLSEMQSLPDQPSVSGLSQDQQPVLPEMQSLPDQPSVSGLSQDQQPALQEIQGLPDQPSVSGLSLEHRPVFREIQNLSDQHSVSGSKPEQQPEVLKETENKEILQDQPAVLENKRKRKRSLKDTGSQPGHRKRLVPKLSDLPPYCRKVYDEYRRSKKQLNFLKRAKRAMKFSKSECFEKLTNNLNPLAKKIIWMQITQGSKKLKGRRFTDEEKMIALAVMKQSPKAYRFLQKIFILPSRNTLTKLTSHLNVQPGINDQIFQAIKDQVENWTDTRKYCSIIFDEVKLEPGLDYEKGIDHINGFVHLNKKSNQFADHALAFMIRGAIHKWQQPIAYYFCEGATKNEELRVILKSVIGAVIDTGLIPVAAICDQGQSFQSAIKALMEETQKDRIKAGNPIDNVITLKGYDINVIFDPPHLIKGVRNNFLTKDIKFEGKICKWSDIVDVYKTDCELAETRLLHKLNDTHVIPEKINKMKVKDCTRVLSSTMAGALTYTSKFSCYSDGSKVSDTLKNTAEVVKFFDNLFDSCNGATLSHKRTGGKSLKKAVTESSEHHQFWRQAVKKLNSMKFLDERRGEISVPSLKNWAITLKSYMKLWQFFKTKNIKIMRPRYFNSDPIENFFGQVRAYNYRNNDPTCHSFISTFKSLLITRFIKFHSAGFNCQEDSGSQLLNIKKMFQPKGNKEPETSTPPDNEMIECDLESLQAQVHRERLNVHSRAYTAGWVVRKILKKIKCEQCLNDLTASHEASCNKWIRAREYNSLTKKRLSYPSEYVVRLFGSVVKETNQYLERKPHLNSISMKIKDHILAKYSTDFLRCEVHKPVVLNMLISTSVKFSIFNWCNSINKILKGTDICRLRGVIPFMQKKALNKYKKKLKNK